MTYADTDCIIKTNMTDEETEYYEGVFNKMLGIYKWKGLPKHFDTFIFEKIMARYGRINIGVKGDKNNG